MEIEILTDEKLHKQFLITYNASDVQECIQRQAEDMQPEVKVNGFRPGKVPTEYIIRIYGEKLRIDAMNKKVGNDVSGLLTKNNLQLAVPPIYKFRERTETADTNFYLEVDFYLFPDVPEHDFSKVAVTKYLPTEQSFEEIVDKNLMMLQILASDFKEKTGAIAENDKVLFTVDISVDGVNLDGLGGELSVVIGHEQIPANIETNIIGMSVGENKEFEHSYADDDKEAFDPALLGKTVLFNVKVIEVQEPEIQELNEERLKKLGFSEAEHLIDALKNNTRNMIEGLALKNIRIEILKYIRENFDFDIPEIVLRQEANQIAYNEASLLTNSDAMQETLDGMRQVAVTDEHLAKARYNLITSFVLMDYAKRHKIDVEEHEMRREMENQLHELQRMNKIRPDAKEKNYEEFQTRVRMLILETKIISDIIKQVSVSENLVSKDEFFALMEKAA